MIGVVNLIKNKEMKVVSLFSGIGAFEKGLCNLGIPYKIEAFSEIDKWAITSYCAIHNTDEEKNLGDISKVEDLSSFKEIDLVTGGSPCFKAGTYISTSKGQKKIEEINKGDMVFTHKNRLKEVVATMKNFTKDIYKLEVVGSIPTYVTGEHPYYVRELKEVWNDKEEKYTMYLAKPIWKTVDEITNRDFVGFNINDLEVNLNKYTEEDCYNLGMISSLASKSKIAQNFLNEAINLPVELLLSFIKGYIGKKSIVPEKMYKVKVHSEKTALVFAQIVSKVYETVHFINYNEGVWQVQFKAKKSHSSLIDNYIWQPIYGKKVIKDFNSYVYNFEVKDDNSYVANNCIVHNCQDFSVAGKQQGSEYTCLDCEATFNPLMVSYLLRDKCQECNSLNLDKTRSSLLIEYLRVIRKVKPKYFIYENVKNIIGKRFKEGFDFFNEELKNYGYNTYYDVLNAKDYGIPQNRERIFVIGIREDIDNGSFEFPKPLDSNLRLKHLLEDSVHEKYYIKKERCEKLLEKLKEKEVSNSVRVGGRGSTGRHQWDLVAEKEESKEDILWNILCEKVKSKNQSFSYCIDANYYKGTTVNDFLTKSRRQLVVVDDKKTNEPNQCKQLLTIPKYILNDNERQRRVYSTEGISPSILSRSDSAKILQIGLLDMKGSEQVRRVYSPEGIAPTLDTMQGGHREPKVIWKEKNKNDIQMIEVKQLVRIRKYSVDSEGLVNCLRSHKEQSNLTNRQIAEKLNEPITLIEHWFRRDNSFSIPDADIWYELKKLLNINTKEYDLSITEFIEKEGVYEKSNRYYHENGVAPTLTTGGNERIIQQSSNNLKFIGGLGNKDWAGDGKSLSRNYPQGERVYSTNGIACSQTSQGGGTGSYTGLYLEEPVVTVHKSIKPSVAKNFEREKGDILKSNKEIYQCKCDSGWQDNKVGLKVSPTLRAGNSHTSALDNNYRIRKLTPLECWRLMGFYDEDYYIARKSLMDTYYNGRDRSNSQMYKQAGNSIVVKVLEEIYRNLFSSYIN